MAISRIGALATGAMLFALPFFQSGLGETHSHGPGPHMNHEPRHGGYLVMIGDFHLEVVETQRTLELYVSDAERRPVRAAAASVVFDGDSHQNFPWSGYRLVAPRPERFDWADCRIEIVGQVPLTIRLPAGGPGEAAASR